MLNRHLTGSYLPKSPSHKANLISKGYQLRDTINRLEREDKNGESINMQPNKEYGSVGIRPMGEDGRFWPFNISCQS